MYIPSYYPKSSHSEYSAREHHTKYIEHVDKVTRLFGLCLVAGKFEEEEGEDYYEVAFSNSKFCLNDVQRDAYNQFVKASLQRVQDEGIDIKENV